MKLSRIFSTIGVFIGTVHAQPTVEEVPTSLDDMVQRMEWASQMASSSLEDSGEAMTHKEMYHVLLTLHFASTLDSPVDNTGTSTPARQVWHTSPEFSSHLEDLVRAALETGICGPESMPMVFEAIRILPDSETVADLVITALNQSGSIGPIWIDNLHTRVGDENIEAIRIDVLSEDVHEVKAWQLALLATSTNSRATETLEHFVSRLCEVESTQDTRRPLGRRRSDSIQRYATLSGLRYRSEELITWGIKQGGVGGSAMGVWAFDEVVRLEGVSSPVWANLWDKLLAESDSQADSYFLRASMSPTSSQRETYIAMWMRPWIIWADANGVAMSDTIRSLVPPDSHIRP